MAASSAAALALEHFAEHGYVVVEDAIDQATVAELNRIVDLRLQHEQGAAEAISSSRGYAKYDFSDGQPFLRSALQPTVIRLPRGDADGPPPPNRKYTEPLGWSTHIAEQSGARSLGAFRKLIEPPVVAAILTALLGDPKWGHADPDTPVDRRGEYRLDHDCEPEHHADFYNHTFLTISDSCVCTRSGQTFTTKGLSAPA